MKKYISEKAITRFLLILTIILAITTGYFQVLYEVEQNKYLRLEDKFVRVRQELGSDELERLIERSY